MIDASDRSSAVLTNQTTALLALKSTGDPNCLTRTLEALQPRYVILYDLDISYIRQLEVGVVMLYCMISIYHISDN